MHVILCTTIYSTIPYGAIRYHSIPCRGSQAHRVNAATNHKGHNIIYYNTIYYNICIYVCMYAYIYIYMHVYIYIYIYTCTCITLSLSLYIYIYICICTYIQIHNIIMLVFTTCSHHIRQNESHLQCVVHGFDRSRHD